MKLNMQIINAIHDLCPGAGFSISGDDLSTLNWFDDLPRPSDEEILDHVEVMKIREKEEAYKIIRKNNYPDINDQLDQIWHMMDDDTIPGKGSTWYNTILDVKNRYPKTQLNNTDILS